MSLFSVFTHHMLHHKKTKKEESQQENIRSQVNKNVLVPPLSVCHTFMYFHMNNTPLKEQWGSYTRKSDYYLSNKILETP